MILLQSWRLTSDLYGSHPTPAFYDLLPLKNENCCAATRAQAKQTTVRFLLFPPKLYCPELQRDAIPQWQQHPAFTIHHEKELLLLSASSFEEILPTYCWNWDLILCVVWPGPAVPQQPRFSVAEELEVWCLQVPPASAGWSRDVLRGLARKLG